MRTTWRYLLGRGWQALLVLWAAFSVSFLILYALPSDPVSIMLNQSGEQTTVNQQQVAALRAQYHLDEPLAVQYGIALWHAVQLDFGNSIQSGQPVSRPHWPKPCRRRQRWRWCRWGWHWCWASAWPCPPA